MKKILTILAVALLSTATVFAVSFSGSIDTGAALTHNNGWSVEHYGNDGIGTAPARINLSVADENGIWSASFGTVGEKLNSSGKFGANLTINLSKAFGEDFPVDIKGTTTYNDRYTTLRAYANKSGNNLDRMRTISSTHFAATIAYEKYVTVAASYNVLIGRTHSASVSALSEPLTGLKVSAGYVLGGENKAKDWLGLPKPDTALVGGAVDVNIGKLCDLDFDLGVSAADRYQFEDKLNTIAAVVYGGYEMVDAYVEYGLQMIEDTSVSMLETGIGVDLDVVKINAWFGANDLTAFADNYFVGGSVGATLAGLNFKLGVEYSATANDSFNEYGKQGITIVPSVGVSF